uniref:Peptidase S8 pro-domain domain-containing protein n=1 Tax=Denticeps clupeoides TaxID=299321 RepID=A0AAY4BH94_9TELE
MTNKFYLETQQEGSPLSFAVAAGNIRRSSARFLFMALLHFGAVLLLTAASTETAAGSKGVYTNTWAVHVRGGAGEAERIARKHGFVNHGNVFGDYYHFQHRSVAKRSLSAHQGVHVRLDSDPQVNPCTHTHTHTQVRMHKGKR